MQRIFLVFILCAGCGGPSDDDDAGRTDAGMREDAGPDDAGVQCTDGDGDGHGVMPCGDDCDDGNADVHPGAAETCDNVDEDCNGAVDDALASTSCTGGGPNEVATCTAGACGIECAPGFLECDDAAAGCETDGTAEASCGACAHSCLHAGCDSGRCSADFVEISVGSAFACARRGSGAVECWGLNGYGQLGDGTLVEHDTPAEISDAADDFVQIAAGYSHACARRSSGAVACWGRNNNGQLGNGTSADSPIPVAVTGITDAVEIASGQYHSCARLMSGPVVCWGSNYNGELGDPTIVDVGRNAPVTVVGLADAVRLSAGGTHTCARTESGPLVCWGGNAEGQLGDGSQVNSASLVEVPGLTGARGIAAGYNHTCARDADNAVQCWGANTYGQLGTGTTSMRSTTPVMAMTGLATAVELSSGAYRTCARGGVGIVTCWGNGGSGALGDNTGNDRSMGVRAMGIDSAVEISAGFDSTCARLSTDQVMCWGRNAYGEVGDGTTTERYAPVPIVDP